VALSMVFVALRVSPLGTALTAAAAVVVSPWRPWSQPAQSPMPRWRRTALRAARCLPVVLPQPHRRRAAAGLIADRESEQRFRSAMEHSAIGMALVGLDGRWLKANRALSEMLGYGTEELASLTFRDITHPDDLATDLDLPKEAISGEIDTYRMEKRYFRKDGSQLWALLAVSLVRDERTNAPLYFISQIADDAQACRRRRSEERKPLELRPGKRRPGVWDHGLRNNKAFYSPVWKAIFGYAPDEFGDAGDAWEDLIHPDDLDRVMRTNRDHLAGLTPSSNANSGCGTRMATTSGFSTAAR
jgi:PAS domain S-box-containing protein